MKLKTFVIESQRWTANMGWGNGYVVIPEGHPLHKIHYNDLYDKHDFSVNGGITWSEMAGGLKDEPDFVQPTDWIIGFDTAHFNDSLAKWPDADSVKKEARRLAAQIEILYP